MKLVHFKPSQFISIGTELELQIIDPKTYAPASRAKDLIRNIQNSRYQKTIKPEITQSMIEINSSIHRSPQALHKELLSMQAFLLQQAKKLNVLFCGGGTHPFQKWTSLKIFPSKRFKKLSHHYRYLSKRSTVFGQHIHIGCLSAEDALYLTHVLARYVPHLIAINAASPFYQGVDTWYHSARSNVFSAFPLSGTIPYLTNWEDFSAYFNKMRQLKIVDSMKDFYWDIRPKPEFGTVEIRVCDTPLTINKAVLITAYIQTLAHYLLTKKPFTISPDLYFIYDYNRFQAVRYGFEGDFIDPYTSQHKTIGEDILQTLKILQPYTKILNNTTYILQLIKNVRNDQDDASFLRKIYKKTESFPAVVHKQCELWQERGKAP